MSFKLENWRESEQDRHFELLAENYLFCRFTEVNKDETIGWCKWNRDVNGYWWVIDSSRGTGEAIARDTFGTLLDEIHLKLIAEKELL